MVMFAAVRNKTQNIETNFEVSIAFVRAQDASTFRQFFELLVEYERSLPIELRHGPAPNLTFVRKAYDEPNAAFTVSMGDLRAGCVAVTRQDKSTAIVQRLYVRPEYRDHGLGRGLVVVAINFCRERSYERVALDTDREQLPAAFRLYVSLGFTDCEPYGPVTYESPTFMALRLK